jgi:toxin ParE1/3/4
VACSVLLTEDAAGDLRDIYTYVAEHDSPKKAEYVLDRIEKKFINLADQLKQGGFVKELLNLGIRDFREIFFKPYRIIYRINSDKIYVYLIADGRRDMQTLLQRRILGAEGL